MSNEKIILRHMAATVLSAFFKSDPARFENAESLVGSWSNPCAATDLRESCGRDGDLKRSLRKIVPKRLYAQLGLEGSDWVDRVAGPDSRLALVEAEVCDDYLSMDEARRKLIRRSLDGNQPSGWTSRVGRLEKRMKTIARERTLNMLSRKAVIPKYGFPVDVVELDTRPIDGNPTRVALQRDRSQAIAEYAPGGKVVANKLEWESCGVKAVTGKAWPVRRYRFDDARSFRQWSEDDPSGPPNARKYLVPAFGLVTPLFKQPSEPHGRARRLYTTRPFFRGFGERTQPETNILLRVKVTKALPGTMVVLCEGKNREAISDCR